MVAVDRKIEFEIVSPERLVLSEPVDMAVIPGVIDSTSNIIEHPQTVAERIVRYASVLGRERIIAGVDCGFGTVAAVGQVDNKIVYAKLRSLAEGAALASAQLWN